MDNAITDLIWIDYLLLCLPVLAMNAKIAGMTEKQHRENKLDRHCWGTKTTPN